MEETTKRDFTEVDIARALMDIPEYKKKILCGSLKLEELIALACDEKKFNEYRSSVMDQVDIYLAYADALHLFHDNLATCKNADKEILGDFANKLSGYSKNQNIRAD